MSWKCRSCRYENDSDQLHKCDACGSENPNFPKIPSLDEVNQSIERKIIDNSKNFESTISSNSSSVWKKRELVASVSNRLVFIKIAIYALFLVPSIGVGIAFGSFMIGALSCVAGLVLGWICTTVVDWMRCVILLLDDVKLDKNSSAQQG